MRLGRSVGVLLREREQRAGRSGVPSCPGGLVTRQQVEDVARAVQGLETRVNLVLGALVVAIAAELLRWLTR